MKFLEKKILKIEIIGGKRLSSGTIKDDFKKKHDSIFFIQNQIIIFDNLDDVREEKILRCY